MRPWTPDDKAALAIAIGQVFDLQKQYGKTASQLETMIAGFCWALKAYPVEKVLEGLSVHVLQSNDMPTPFDIRQIIDPIPPKFKPNPSYYVKLQKIFEAEGPFGLDLDEMEYIRKYEDHMNKERKGAV